MNNVYELFDRCIQSMGTTKASYCSKALNDIIPSEKYVINEINSLSNLVIQSSLDFEINNDEYTEWKIIDNNKSFTNDDASVYLRTLMNLFMEAKYLKNYEITLNDTNDSLVAIMETVDNDKKSELYDVFSELPKAFNSRVMAYLS